MNSFVKVNVDGSAKGNPGLSAAGGIIRDRFGQWLSGFNSRFSFLPFLWQNFGAFIMGFFYVVIKVSDRLN